MPQNSAEHRAGAYQMLERLNLRCAAWPAARCGRDFAEVVYNNFGNLLTVGHTGRVNVNDFLGDVLDPWLLDLNLNDVGP